MDFHQRLGRMEYHWFMPPPVRVIGRVDLSEKIREALRSAGLDAEVVTGGPMSVYGGTPPDQGIDVVAATSIFDPPLWRLAKRRHPTRPMVAVAERRRESALRGAVARRFGPDAYVTWPATPAELASAIQRAESAVVRRRSFGRADLASALFWCGLLLTQAPVGGGGLPSPWALLKIGGSLVAGFGLLLGVPFAWNARWQAAGGVVLTLLGVVAAASVALPWFR